MEEIWEKMLARVRENFAWEAEELFPGGPTAFCGPIAMRTLASDLQA